jgi:hypothetical protein
MFWNIYIYKIINFANANIFSDVILILAGASFMLGRALTSIFWGFVADRIGRKPVILFWIVSASVFLFPCDWIFFLQIGPASDYFWPFLYSQVCIQYFVWTEYALLDGTSYAISSWFFKWFAWPDEGTMTELFKWRQGGIRKHLNEIAISNMSTDLFTGVRCWSLSTRASGHWIVTCKLQNYTNTVFTISLAQKFTSWHLLSIWLIRLAHHGNGSCYWTSYWWISCPGAN